MFKAYIDSKRKVILVSKKEHPEFLSIPISMVLEYQSVFCYPIFEEFNEN